MTMLREPRTHVQRLTGAQIAGGAKTWGISAQRGIRHRISREIFDWYRQILQAIIDKSQRLELND